MRVASAASVFLLSCLCTLPLLHAQVQAQPASASTPLGDAHASPEWANISLHLPDLATSSPATLEVAADTLRARRYPQDAVRYYSAAIVRGGDQGPLLKKTGIACLEMQQIELAELYFQQAVRLNKRDAGAWNNLGAADFILHNNARAIRNYKRAVKLESGSAVFHANLALAYFEARNSGEARRELAKGLAIDPDLLHKSAQGGYTAQVLASERYSEICFEMARIYASQGNMEGVLEWLTKASDRGYDVHGALAHDPTLRPLLTDARIEVLLKNKQQLEAKGKPPANIPSLGAADR